MYVTNISQAYGEQDRLGPSKAIKWPVGAAYGPAASFEGLRECSLCARPLLWLHGLLTVEEQLWGTPCTAVIALMLLAFSPCSCLCHGVPANVLLP
jgi:hypothetical protein